ncbi:hypothetical protein OIY81_3641 [Cryptosporidium canis]|nr:hypothetical protein OIY81_3641 [Cryptosporidium canis]
MSIESNRSSWTGSAPGRSGEEEGGGGGAGKPYAKHGGGAEDNVNTSLSSLRSLLEDFLRSVFSPRAGSRSELQVFLTSNFNWRRMNNYAVITVPSGSSLFGGLDERGSPEGGISASGGAGRSSLSVSLPARVRSEMDSFEKEYRRDYPHRRISWLWENGFAVLAGRGFRAAVAVEGAGGVREEVIGELLDFSVACSLSVSVVLLLLGELSEEEEMTMGEVVRRTRLSPLEVTRILLSLSLPRQRLVLFLDGSVGGMAPFEMTKERVINWSYWINGESRFRLSDVIIRSDQGDTEIFRRRIMFCPRMLSNELFSCKGPSSDSYLRSIGFSELFEEGTSIDCQEYYQLPNAENCFRSICRVRYPWNADIFLDDESYESYFSFMSSLIGSDDVFYSIVKCGIHGDDDLDGAADEGTCSDSVCEFKTSTFVYRDNFGVLFNESYNIENLESARSDKDKDQDQEQDKRDSGESAHTGRFRSVIIDEENSLRVLNHFEVPSSSRSGGSLSNGNSGSSSHWLKPSAKDPDSSPQMEENPVKRRCISGLEGGVQSDRDDGRARMSSSCSSFSISSTGSPSLVYMEHSASGRLSDGCISGMIDTVCKLESVIVKLLKRAKSKSYSEILDYISEHWDLERGNIPSVSSIDTAIAKLMKREFIRLVCMHSNQQCSCKDIPKQLLSISESAPPIDLFSENSLFEYVH